MVQGYLDGFKGVFSFHCNVSGGRSPDLPQLWSGGVVFAYSISPLILLAVHAGSNLLPLCPRPVLTHI